MHKAFWFLAFILMFSTLGGFVLGEEITWLLFERGAFGREDTLNTAAILQMYMIGLLPFGLNKLLLLWLYARQQQMKAAKIATLTLGTNILFSLLLITPLGGVGLALASTISGFIGFFATARTFSRQEFLAIISLKKTVLLLLSGAVFTLFLIKSLRFTKCL